MRARRARAPSGEDFLLRVNGKQQGALKKRQAAVELTTELKKEKFFPLKTEGTDRLIGNLTVFPSQTKGKNFTFFNFVVESTQLDD